MIDALLDPLGYDFFVRALLAAVVVGTVCAVVGTFVVLRGIAFIGDAVAHASFPGVVAAYLLAIPFYLGAAVAAVATALAIGYVTRRARIRADTAIGVLFAGTFALGVFLYSTIEGYVADLFSFLFGYLLSIDLSDLIALTALGGLVLLIVGVFWKELLYATFDPQGAAASGLRVDWLEYLFLALVALTIVISLQAVGIILVVAMLVTPAAAAQLLTVRFGSLMALAIVLAVASSVAGLYLSFWLDVASGATIVLVQTALFLAILVASPRTRVQAPVPPGSDCRRLTVSARVQPGAVWVVGRSRRSASVGSAAATATRNERRFDGAATPAAARSDCSARTGSRPMIKVPRAAGSIWDAPVRGCLVLVGRCDRAATIGHATRRVQHLASGH